MTIAKCGHCKCEFALSPRQAKRARLKSRANASMYCSRVCQDAGEAKKRTKPLPYGGVCPTCGESFGSRYAGKKYCCQKCYTESAEFKVRIREQAKKANAASVLKRTSEPIGPRVDVTCQHCGKTQSRKPSQANRKFCNPRCYRAFMADRFDRWVASPESIALPQNYDEFMMQEDLPCLVEGCNWSGKSLANHVNFAHGVTAQEFKRAAGFNLRTGLVAPETAERMANRSHIHENPFGGVRPDHSRTVGPTGYKSLEGREHATKARALMAAGEELQPRDCEGCGALFTPGPISYGAKFCTVECRDKHYARKLGAKIHPMHCSLCRKSFFGNTYQARRRDAAKRVFCSVACRQKNNGKVGGETKRRRRAKAAEVARGRSM